RTDEPISSSQPSVASPAAQFPPQLACASFQNLRARVALSNTLHRTAIMERSSVTTTPETKITLDANGDGMSVFQNPRFRLCAHHLNAGSQAAEAMPMYNFFVCLNDSRYTKIFSDMERGISDRRDRGLPILAAIIGVYCLFILFGAFGNGL
uniref:AA_permease domain-containing protein n=1 Tax=Macrostomum lignano TaxID=282301 RepID=A0A1I8HHK2_9PLAT